MDIEYIAHALWWLVIAWYSCLGVSGTVILTGLIIKLMNGKEKC